MALAQAVANLLAGELAGLPFGWFPGMHEIISQGLKPAFSADRSVRAKARTYLRSKNRANGSTA